MSQNQEHLPQLYQPPTEQSQEHFGEALSGWDPNAVAHWARQQPNAPPMHYMMAAGTARRPGGDVYIMVSANYLEPMKHQDPRPRFSQYTIETINPRNGEYLFYQYAPRQAVNDPNPEVRTGHAVLDPLNDPYDRIHEIGFFGFQHPKSAGTQLAPEDMARIREYIEAAEPNALITQNMVNNLRQRFRESYPADQPPKESTISKLGKKAWRWAIKTPPPWGPFGED